MKPHEAMAVRVCRLEDIVPDTGVCALVGGEQVAVFRLDDDSVHAIGNRDPFSRANVLSRGIVGDLKGELVVASPVYKQHFSLLTGRCVEDAAVRIPVYAARVEDGFVVVEPRQRGGHRPAATAASAAASSLGPKNEIFAVTRRSRASRRTSAACAPRALRCTRPIRRSARLLYPEVDGQRATLG